MVQSHIGPARGPDAASVLTAYICLLLAVPAPMVVGPLGTAGSPATILGIAAFFWWLWFHLQREQPLQQGFQPVRTAMLAWLFIMLVVYAHAMTMPIPADEISPADSGMLRLVGMAGVLLVANDGIASMSRGRAVLRRLVLGIGIVAVFGLVQYLTKQLYVDRLSIPGLTAGTAEWALGQRSGFARPSGTSTHPIEFGVVLTMVLPLVVVFATRSPTRRWLYKALLCVVAFAIFLSISRSAIVCAGISMLVLAFSWSAAARLRALGFALVVAVVVYLSVPGLLGTIVGLFTGISDDSSVQSRTGSYDVAAQFISRSPIFGRGLGTFLPKYWILDNGYLGLLIEGGIVGVVGLFAVICSAVYCARRTVALAENEFDRDIAMALLAAVIAGAVGLAFFDTFAFPQSAGTFFMLLGITGAHWRLARNRAAAKPGLTHPGSMEPVRD